MTFELDTEIGVFTFEFQTSGTAGAKLADGNYAVVIHQNDSATTVAAEIAAAINAVPSSTKFGVKAEVLLEPSDRVNLFGGVADVAAGPLGLLSFDGLGDAMPVRVQGYTIIADNKISNSLDIAIASMPQTSTDANGDTVVGVPGHTGSVTNAATLNTAKLVPGFSFYNNLIVNAGEAGIVFSGSPTSSVSSMVPFGRIFNNTIVNAPIGIDVLNNASPTILNNIITQASTAAIMIDSTSTTSVVGETVYQNDTAKLVGLSNESNPVYLQPTSPLFVDATNGNYYLKSGSQAIDSSINTLPERSALIAVQSPLGIANSPIQAPAYDLFGQLRVDDPNVNPQGVGSNPFKDRGAIEEADFSGPTALLTNPVDNDGAGLDRNPSLNKVLLIATPISNFTIQLSDKGVGLDPATVTGSRITLTRNGTALALGSDYSIALDTTNGILRLIPSTSVWASGTYVISLDNSSTGIKDLVGNQLQPNNNDGTTQFSVQITNTTVSPWQNTANKYDVDNNGQINPTDALIIINRLLLGLSGVLASPTPYPPYIDVNGDGRLTTIDALQVINYLNLYGVTPATPGAATPSVATPGSTSSPAVVSAATSSTGTVSSTVVVASAAASTSPAAATSSAADFNSIVSSVSPTASVSSTSAASTPTAAAVDAVVSRRLKRRRQLELDE